METIELRDDFRLEGLHPVGKDVKQMIRLSKELSKTFKAHNKDIHSVNIFCRGSSGAMLASLFAASLGNRDCTVIHVRKDGESSHSNYSGASHAEPDEEGVNVFIDDFMRSCETVNAIYKVFKALRPWHCKKWEVDYLLIYNYSSLDNLKFKPKFLISKV